MLLSGLSPKTAAISHVKPQTHQNTIIEIGKPNKQRTLFDKNKSAQTGILVRLNSLK
jgi:hypothetical protein